MAGLLETYLQDIRVNYPNLLDRDEWRTIRFGLVNSAVEQTNSPLSVITEDFKTKAMASEGRVLGIPVMKKGALLVKNVRSCSISSYENESDMVELVWSTLVVDITMVKAQYAKNEVSYLSDLAKKLVLVKEALLSEIEGAIYTRLDTDKSGIYSSTLVGVGAKHELVADTADVALANHNLFFNDVEAIQQADDFYGENYIIGSTNLMPFVNHYVNQGSGNNTNLNYQFAGKSFSFSNSVVDGANKLATGFIMPFGSLGVLTRIDRDSIMGNVSSDGTEWGITRVDGIPFDLGYRYKSTCSDQSALNGTGMEHLEATMLEQWTFSVDYALVTPYNSDPATRAGSIRKFQLHNA